MANLERNSLFSVNGLVAVITGGGTGIGLMIAKALEANGAAKVYIIGRRKDVLESAASQGQHGNIIPIVGDVSSKESLQSVAARIKSEVGYVNLLVPNSGIGGPPNARDKVEAPPTLSEFVEQAWSDPMEEFTRTYAVNCTGVYYTVLAFLELLDAGNRKGNMGPEVKSQIITTSSIGSFNRNAVAGFAYCTSKAAVTHLMKQFATFFTKWSIRCNALAPGLFMSELAAPLVAHARGDATKTGAFDKSYIPAERIGSEEDMGGTVLYMASRAGAYLNGNIMVIDGGRLSTLPATY
ncbi:NAD(P)-binding protein [Viridothelium virens]|uniref:NAD(P)-binding protein n=1 Tax=Viridothelium virens TaxID=1048519 RepID=A0A6A6HNT0_VIRVR|nr:NAD(P)-binding protein [Viridothelium virens]